MKKIYLSADIEGIWGNSSGTHTAPSGALYQEYCTNMMNEVNLAIDVLFRHGVEEVLVNDSHGNMDNLLPSKLDPRASFVGANGAFKAYGMMEGFDDSFDGVCFIGYHCRSNTPQGIMAHTIWGKTVHKIEVDGKELGESGINARLAWEYGVPVILVTGDDLLKEQLKEELDSPFAYVETKRSISSQCAVHCSRNALKERYDKGIAEALSYLGKQQKKILPHSAEIMFHQERNADFASRMDNVERVDRCTVRFAKDSYDELYTYMRYIIKTCNTFA